MMARPRRTCMQRELTNSYEAQLTPLQRHQPSWEHPSICTDTETVRYRFTHVSCPLFNSVNTRRAGLLCPPWADAPGHSRLAISRLAHFLRRDS